MATPRQPEEPTQQPEERLRILAEATSEGIVVIEHGRIIDVSDQYARMFRGDPAAFIGHEVASFVAPESRALVAERIRLRSEEPYEHRALRLDGTVSRMLERNGFAVLRARDGQEAIELFRAHAAEVVCVLLDLAMPRMDGEETFKELCRIYPGVRVILASGYSDQEIAQRFQNAGLAGFIEKPYRVETLAAKLREVLAPCG